MSYSLREKGTGAPSTVTFLLWRSIEMPFSQMTEGWLPLADERFSTALTLAITSLMEKGLQM